MQEIAETMLKSLVSVLLLFALARAMGKKQVSQLTFFDYVAGISIGSIAADFAVDGNIDYLRGVTGLVVYALFPILLSWVSLKSYRGRKALDGVPSILIQNGRIIESNLVRTKLNVNDLLEECRLKNAFDIADVEFAILETSGKLSVLLKSPNQPLTPKDMNMPVGFKGLCANLVIDGQVLRDHLGMLGKDEAWLAAELSKQNVSDAKDVLLAYLDSSGGVHVHRKGGDPPMPPIL